MMLAAGKVVDKTVGTFVGLVVGVDIGFEEHTETVALAVSKSYQEQKAGIRT